jgi:hypothetical protein
MYTFLVITYSMFLGAYWKKYVAPPLKAAAYGKLSQVPDPISGACIV